MTRTRRVVLVLVCAVGATAALAVRLADRGPPSGGGGPGRADPAVTLAVARAVDRLAARDSEGARRFIDLACEAAPDDAEVAYVASAVAASEGDLRRSWVHAQKAATCAPRNGEMALAAGLVARTIARTLEPSGSDAAWAERARRWFDAAVARSEAAVERHPSLPEARLHAAAARLASGDPDRAGAHLDAFRHGTPGQREQAAVLRTAARAARGDRIPESPPDAVHETASLASVRDRARSFQVFVDDRAGFDAAVQASGQSSVVDSGGTFAPDPAAATGLAVVSRSGTLAGEDYAYDVRDADFSNAPPGTLTPGVVGGDVADTDTLAAETPASQGGALGAGTWGVDGSTGSSTSRNALIVDFTTTPGGLGIGHFGVDLVDFEASAAFRRGELRLYDGGVLVFSHLFDWGGDDGNGTVHFLGVVAAPAVSGLFDQVAVALGDDSAGNGFSEQWAADRFTFGAPAEAVPTPEPGTWALFAVGAAVGIVARLRRSRRTAAGAESSAGDSDAP